MPKIGEYWVWEFNGKKMHVEIISTFYHVFIGRLFMVKDIGSYVLKA